MREQNQRSLTEPVMSTAFDPIPEEAHERVRTVLASTRLFRYGGNSVEENEASLLEKEMAAYTGAKYALAVNSCSSALHLALISHGIQPGDKVLMSAFTFIAVPSAIMHAHAIPVLVECDQNCHLDTDDLKRKISPETKALVLSHMRGHVSDLDTIKEICETHNILLIEDAAHSLGVKWGDQMTGSIGDAGCYSFQSNKIINAGEGGMLVTNNEEVAVKAVLYSGAFEDAWKKHFFESPLFEQYREHIPAYNFRLNNLAAAIIRPQIHTISQKRQRYQDNHHKIREALSHSPHIVFPKRLSKENPAPNTLQFQLPNLTEAERRAFSANLRARGFKNAIFGLDPENARVFWNWKFLQQEWNLPQTTQLLKTTCDLKTPYYWGESEIEHLTLAIMDSLVTDS